MKKVKLLTAVLLAAAACCVVFTGCFLSSLLPKQSEVNSIEDCGKVYKEISVDENGVLTIKPDVGKIGNRSDNEGISLTEGIIIAGGGNSGKLSGNNKTEVSISYFQYSLSTIDGFSTTAIGYNYYDDNDKGTGGSWSDEIKINLRGADLGKTFSYDKLSEITIKKTAMKKVHVTGSNWFSSSYDDIYPLVDVDEAVITIAYLGEKFYFPDQYFQTDPLTDIRFEKQPRALYEAGEEFVTDGNHLILKTQSGKEYAVNVLNGFIGLLDLNTVGSRTASFGFYGYTMNFNYEVQSALTYEKIADGYAVSRVDPDKARIYIPQKHNGEPITAIKAGAFDGCDKITDIAIPNNIKAIEQGALKGMRNLTELTVPVGADMRVRTFFGSQRSDIPAGLAKVAIAEGSESVYSYMFFDCEGTPIKELVVPASVKSVDDTSFSGLANNLTKLTYPGHLIIGNKFQLSAGEDGTLPTVTVAPGSVAVADGWLKNNASVERAELPDSVTNIGSEAFSGCTELSSVLLPSQFNGIGAKAFYGCVKLPSVQLSSLVSIGAGAFEGCAVLSRLQIPVTTTSIAERAFANCTTLTQAVIPANVTNLGGSMFLGCTSLTRVDALSPSSANFADNWLTGSSVTELTVAGDKTLAKLRGATVLNIVKLTVPNGGAESICADFAKGQAMLAQVVLPPSVRKIGASAFENCTGLEQINLDAVSEAGTAAFKNCQQLSVMNFSTGLTLIYADALTGTAYLDSRASEAYVVVGDGILYKCNAASNEVTLPDNVKRIGMRAFAGNANVRNVIFGGNVIELFGGAFAGGAVTYIKITTPNIPAYVNQSAGALFDTALTKIDVPLESIDRYKAAAGFSAVASKVQPF